MNRKSIYTAIGATILGVTLLTQLFTVTPGQSIQSAVNAANAGDTITVEAGAR